MRSSAQLAAGTYEINTLSRDPWPGYAVILTAWHSSAFSPTKAASVLGEPIGIDADGYPAWLKAGHIVLARGSMPISNLWWYSSAASTDPEDLIEFQSNWHLPAFMPVEQALRSQCKAQSPKDILFTAFESGYPFSKEMNRETQAKKCLIGSLKEQPFAELVTIAGVKVSVYRTELSLGLIQLEYGAPRASLISWKAITPRALRSLTALGITLPQAVAADLNRGLPAGTPERILRIGNIAIGFYQTEGTTSWKTIAIWRRVNLKP